MDRLQKIFLASAITLMISLSACFGGGGSTSADTGFTQAQFDALLKTSALYATQQSTISTLQTHQAADEKTLANVALIGHAPGTSAISLMTASATASRTQGILLPAVSASTVDFGQCSSMGQYVGSSAPDPSGSTVDFFKQCTGVTYGVNTSTILADGNYPVAAATFVWFDQPNCQGNVIEFENDGQYNDRTLLGGVAFFSPQDGNEYWVAPTGAGVTPAALTSASIYSTVGGCVNATEHHVGFIAVANVIDGASGSGVPAEVNPYVL